MHGLLRILACVVPLTVAYAQQQCFPFQSLATPRAVPSNLGQCAQYASNGCCSNSLAKRAYNWVVEDDGCGTVFSGGSCAQYLTDFACAINCNPNLYVNGINYNTADYGLPSMPYGFPVICSSWAAQAYEACAGYSWCLPNNGVYTDCKAFSVLVNGGGQSRVARFPDTCQLIYSLSDSFSSNPTPNSGPKAFMLTVLNAIWHPNNNASQCTTPPLTPPASRNPANAVTTSLVSLFAVLAAAIALAF